MLVLGKYGILFFQKEKEIRALCIIKPSQKKKKKYPSIKRSNSSLSYSNLKITKMQICTWLLVQFKIWNYSVLGELFDPQKVQSHKPNCWWRMNWLHSARHSMNDAGGCTMPMYDIQRCVSSIRSHLLHLQEYVVFLTSWGIGL